MKRYTFCIFAAWKTSHQTTATKKHPVARRGLQAEVFNMQLVKAQPRTEHQGHNEAHSGHQSKQKARHTGMAGHSLSISISQQKGTNTWFALAAAQG
jgi:hypothetical protein